MNWLPISSAPKTREILLHYPGIGAVRGTWNSDEHNKYPKPYWVCDRLISWGIRKTRQFQPTHWMELPQAPESEGWASMMRLPADIYWEAKRAKSPRLGVAEHFSGRPINVENLVRAKRQALKEWKRRKKRAQQE